MDALKQGLGAGVRVIPAPCVGRCEQAPVAVVGRNPVAQATAQAVASLVAHKETECPVGDYVDYAAYRAGRRLQARRRMRGRQARCRSDPEDDGKLGAARARRRGFPAGRKWRIVRGEPAPRLMAINIDEGEPGTFKDRYYLERDPHRFSKAR